MQLCKKKRKESKGKPLKEKTDITHEWCLSSYFQKLTETVLASRKVITRKSPYVDLLLDLLLRKKKKSSLKFSPHELYYHHYQYHQPPN